MRPVNKGETPNKKYRKYKDAEIDLEERLGAYCSFCEMSINHVPEVEHKEAKARGGDALAWENLLLSCKYCNTRKGTCVEKRDKVKYLWPDEDDTFHAYRYDGEIPKLNEEYLKMQGEEIKRRAENLYQLLKLDNIPIIPSDKDRRYNSRNEAKICALSSREGLKKMKTLSEREAYLEQTKILAKTIGFFSVWMEVFKDDEEVKKMLVSVFKGTREEYCLE